MDVMQSRCALAARRSHVGNTFIKVPGVYSILAVIPCELPAWSCSTVEAW